MSSLTLDRVLDAVIRVDSRFDIRFVSEQGKQWLTAASPATLPTSFLQLVCADDVDHFRQICDATPDGFSCDIRIQRDGGQCWVQVRGYQLAGVSQFVLCLIDITSWKSDDLAFRHAAEHDDLTGLPNRAFFKKAVEEQLRLSKGRFSIALLDLDGFKKVNDTFGHAMGDAVLIETAKRLNKIVGPQDVFARLGGDEFVLLMVGADLAAAQAKARGILLAIGRPYETAPHNAYLGVSIGLAQFPEHGNDCSVLLKNADTAMYHSKNAGKNRVSVFTPEETVADFSIQSAIHNGIQEGEFYMDFQPQYDMNRQLIGAEALMRWNSRVFGRVPPDKFIPIVEESGLMPFLGTWALRFACHQLRQIQTLMPNFIMSVNVSPVQFGEEDFDQQVLQAIAESGVSPASVVLEITESTLMHSQERTERALAKLREHGIRFSIDDFGTGFSSLAYLTRLPVSSLKIDKAFVRAIEDERNALLTNKKLVTAMISLAHSIDLAVVAEGVENESQFSFLKQSGCNLFQGYLLSKPISAVAFTHMLEQRLEACA
jgi:diguanylate cyclase (GGDEF)-like protein